MKKQNKDNIVNEKLERLHKKHHMKKQETKIT